MFFAAFAIFLLHVRSSFSPNARTQDIIRNKGKKLPPHPFYRQLAQAGSRNYLEKRKTKSKNGHKIIKRKNGK
jgi:hypothetical protein